MEFYREQRLLKDGFASFSPSEKDEYLKALDQQISCLSQFQNQKLALEIDTIIDDLHSKDPRYSWTGIYRLAGNELRLVCFRGPYSPHSVIPLEGGICGAAIREAKTLNIPDVKADPRYLSCDFRTKSEIVVPIFDETGKAIAEIDIDSHLANAFNRNDETSLERLARKLAPSLLRLH